MERHEVVSRTFPDIVEYIGGLLSMLKDLKCVSEKVTCNIYCVRVALHVSSTLLE
jgi:hypothetical protein